MPRTRRQPPSTLVLLVRHGQTPTTGQVLPGQTPGLHLAEAGQAQAALAAERLAELKRVDAVYASHLERAQETARPIAKAHGLRVRTDRDLADIDTGDWTGRPLKEVSRLPEWRTVIHHPSGFRFPGGESFVDMQHRLVAAVERMRARHEGGVVVAVSHADPIKAITAHALGTPLDLFQRLVVSTCSITAIAYGTDRPFVLTVNSTGGSLADLRPS